MKALVLTAVRIPRPGYVVSEFEKRTGCPENGSEIFKNPKLILEDVPVPEIGPKEILLRVRASGICGGDLDFLRIDEDGYILMAYRCKLPLAIGHEWKEFGTLFDYPTKDANRIYLFIARNIEKMSKQNLDISENIKCHSYSLHEVKELVIDGKIDVSGSVAAILKLINSGSDYLKSY